MLVFFCVGLAVAIGAIVFDKESKRPSAQERTYLERARATRARQEAEAKAKERVASEAGAEEAKKKWRKENGKPSPEDIAEHASKIDIGMTTEEVEKIMGGPPLGGCKDKPENLKLFVWDSGEGHTPVIVRTKKGKVAESVKPTTADIVARELLLDLTLKGDCRVPDVEEGAKPRRGTKASGPLDARVDRIKEGMRLVEVQAILQLDPLGFCRSHLDPFAVVYAWDNGPKSTLVEVYFTDGRATRWFKGDRGASPIEIATERSMVLEGACNALDPD